jgi:hypothetical protein
MSLLSSISNVHNHNRELFVSTLDVSIMPPPDEIFANWDGIADNDLFATISKSFDLPSDDSFVYRAESFAMTLTQIQEQVNSGKLKYKYQSHGQQIDVSSGAGIPESRNVD